MILVPRWFRLPACSATRCRARHFRECLDSALRLNALRFSKSRKFSPASRAVSISARTGELHIEQGLLHLMFRLYQKRHSELAASNGRPFSCPGSGFCETQTKVSVFAA